MGAEYVVCVQFESYRIPLAKQSRVLCLHSGVITTVKVAVINIFYILFALRESSTQEPKALVWFKILQRITKGLNAVRCFQACAFIMMIVVNY